MSGKFLLHTERGLVPVNSQRAVNALQERIAALETENASLREAVARASQRPCATPTGFHGRTCLDLDLREEHQCASCITRAALAASPGDYEQRIREDQRQKDAAMVLGAISCDCEQLGKQHGCGFCECYGYSTLRELAATILRGEPDASPGDYEQRIRDVAIAREAGKLVALEQRIREDQRKRDAAAMCPYCQKLDKYPVRVEGELVYHDYRGRKRDKYPVCAEGDLFYHDYRDARLACYAAAILRGEPK